jgi:septum formation topological specificity factor MinE
MPIDISDRPGSPATPDAKERAGRIERALLESIDRDKELIAVVSNLVSVTEGHIAVTLRHQDTLVDLLRAITKHIETMQEASHAARDLAEALKQHASGNGSSRP